MKIAVLLYYVSVMDGYVGSMGPHKKGAGVKSCILQNVWLSTDTKKSHFGHIPPGANSKFRPVFQKTGAFRMKAGSVGCGTDM